MSLNESTFDAAAKGQLVYTLLAADEFHNDSPDGAWWSILEDTVRFHNREYGTDFDLNDTVHDFLVWKKERSSDE
jgi:hypothetical protein